MKKQLTDTENIGRILRTQQDAFRREGAPDLLSRKKALKRLDEAIRAHEGRLTDAVCADFGNRSAYETRILELFPTGEGLKHARRKVGRWMKPERRPVSLWYQPGRARVIYQPLGVVGLIVPWNYPLYLTFSALTGALAAGNRAMIKASELAPHTAEAVRQVLADAFDEDTVAVITGGPDIGAFFAALPFDHIHFTGSTRVGPLVMRAASANLTPVTLELGGKSPAIVGSDASLPMAVERIIAGKLFNAGQTCVAPDYALVPNDLKDRFTETAADVVTRLYPSIDQNPDYTSIINEHHFSRLEQALNDAADKGARCIPIGTGSGESRQFPPTLVLEPTDDMVLMREEIFGPILPIVSYRTLDDAIAYVNGRPHPLALYYFGRNKADIRRVLSRTVSGGVSINQTILHVPQDDLPFGGVGPSGMGQYHGREGFKTFSHARAVFQQPRWNGFRLLYPPYGRLTDLMLKVMSR